MFALPHPNARPTVPVVGDSSSYRPALRGLLEHNGADVSGVLAALMAQAVDWARCDTTRMGVGDLLARAERDVEALAVALSASGAPMMEQRSATASVSYVSRGTMSAADFMRALGQVDHGPLQLALRVRADADLGWDDPGLMALFVHPYGPRTAAFLSAAAPADWRSTMAWEPLSVSATMPDALTPVVPPQGFHPVAVALAHQAWAAAEARMMAQPLAAPEDWDSALHGLIAGLCGRRCRDDLTGAGGTAAAQAWLQRLVEGGADPNRPFSYVVNGSRGPRQEAPLRGLKADATHTQWLMDHGPGWAWTMDRGLVRSLAHGAAVQATASELALMALGFFRDTPHKTMWLRTWTRAWERHGGPRPLLPWWPNGATALVHGTLEALETHPRNGSSQALRMRPLLEAWLPACRAADAAAGVVPWWERSPEADQPWDAWGAAAAVAVRPGLHREGGVVLQRLLADLPERVALPVAAAQRLADLFVRSISWTTAPVPDGRAGLQGDLQRMAGAPGAVVLPCATGGPRGTAQRTTRQMVLWDDALRANITMAFDRMEPARAAGARMWLAQTLAHVEALARDWVNNGTPVDHPHQKTAIDRAALLWEALVAGPVADPLGRRAARVL